MKHTLKNSIMLVLVLLFTNAGTVVFAQGKKEKKEETKEVVMEKQECRHEKEKNHMGMKNLTDDQQQKMEKMKLSNQKEMMQLKNLLAEKKAHLKTLETMDNADMSAINKTIDEMSVIKTDMMKKKAAHKQEIRKILTDEQRLQFDMKHNKEGKQGKQNRKRERRMGGHEGMGMQKEIRIINEKEHDDN